MKWAIVALAGLAIGAAAVWGVVAAGLGWEADSAEQAKADRLASLREEYAGMILSDSYGRSGPLTLPRKRWIEEQEAGLAPEKRAEREKARKERADAAIAKMMKRYNCSEEEAILILMDNLRGLWESRRMDEAIRRDKWREDYWKRYGS